MKGVEFLNKLYRDLYLKTKGNLNKNDAVNMYLKRIDSVNREVTRHNRVDLLKTIYYDKYIIKSSDISDELDKESIINNQKESLDKWLDYLTRSNYPTWAKYWAFRGMLKIGTYNEATDSYQKRSRKTIHPFIELNKGVLDECINTIICYVNDDKLTDSDLDKLVESGNFAKLYTYLLKHKSNNNYSNEGKWVKYRKGSLDYIKLYNSLQGYNTGWCTADALLQAKSQVDGGDFYVYYTKDAKKKYKIPRVAIRMYGNNVSEIRGISDNQNVEEEFDNVIEDKLKSLNIDSSKFIKIINNLKRLTEISRKEELSLDEIKFLYEVDGKINGFGWGREPRVDKIINKRDKTDDLSRLSYSDLEVAIYRNPLRIKDIDKEYLDERLCMIAVKKDPRVIKVIPTEFISDNILYTVYKRNPGLLNEIPRKGGEYEGSRISK